MNQRLSPAVFETELKGNILPFWMKHTLDHENGGFYGCVSNDLQVDNTVERSAVLCARILWTFSKAYGIYKDEQYLRVARHACDYLTRRFWDSDFSGVYWALDALGNPINDRKHTYAQSFAIYGLAEFYQATGEAESLARAQRLFHLVEQHTFDVENQGYVECRGREWQALDDMRLSAKDMNCAKSMNTLLHLMEAYTNLMRVWDDPELKSKQRGLILAFLDHIVDARTHHLKLFFDPSWRSLDEMVSYGHDIEASWLLVEAAEAQGDPDLLLRVRAAALEMAQAVYDQARNADGSLLYETSSEITEERHWWVQAEAVVGFYNAWQISGQAHFAQAAADCWQYVETHHVDRQHGDWLKVLDRHNHPRLDHPKAGPWECPYHHSRACFEMIARLR
jgi:mannobiose 2-epimerase